MGKIQIIKEEFQFEMSGYGEAQCVSSHDFWVSQVAKQKKNWYCTSYFFDKEKQCENSQICGTKMVKMKNLQQHVTLYKENSVNISIGCGSFEFSNLLYSTT